MFLYPFSFEWWLFCYMTVYVYWFEGDVIRLAHNYYKHVTERTDLDKALEIGYI